MSRGLRIPISLALTGMTGSSIITALAAFAVAVNWTTRDVAAYFASVGICGFMALTFLYPRLNRRVSSSTLAVGGLIVAGMGIIGIGFVQQIEVAVGLGIATQGYIAFATVALLAAAGTRPRGGANKTNNSSSVSTARAAYAGGFLVGAPFGGVLVVLAGPRLSLISLGAVEAVVAFVVGIALKEEQSAFEKKPAERTMHKPRSIEHVPLRLIFFAAAFALMSLGGPMRSALLPFYMLKQLHADPRLAGFVVGLAPAFEIPAFFVVARTSRTVTGEKVTLIIGGLSAFAYFAILSTGTSLVSTGALQVLFGLYVACATGSAIAFAQHRFATSPLTATRAMLTAEQAGNLSGSLASVLASAAILIPQLFVVPAVSAAIGLAVLLLLFMRMSRKPIRNEFVGEK